MARGAAHIDIDDLGASGFGDTGTLRHPSDFAAGELNDVRAYSGSFAPQPRHRSTVDEIIARGHFRDDKSGSKCRNQASKGGVRDARHGCQKNPVSDLNIAYFQRFKV
jgi:hypothetical protein